MLVPSSDRGYGRLHLNNVGGPVSLSLCHHTQESEEAREKSQDAGAAEAASETRQWLGIPSFVSHDSALSTYLFFLVPSFRGWLLQLLLASSGVPGLPSGIYHSPGTIPDIQTPGEESPDPVLPSTGFK
ncbi:hypothetical protein LDENG_00127750 [Lucifuga dentata]|nr:hypothetical protein LDENG_00127750 [Lucifuga dentata]